MRLNLLDLTEIEEEMRNLTARANAMLDDDEEPSTSTFREMDRLLSAATLAVAKSIDDIFCKVRICMAYAFDDPDAVDRHLANSIARDLVQLAHERTRDVP
jgi:hypothetical protein